MQTEVYDALATPIWGGLTTIIPDTPTVLPLVATDTILDSWFGLFYQAP